LFNVVLDQVILLLKNVLEIVESVSTLVENAKWKEAEVVGLGILRS
jgi:hypothetical protein